VKGPDGKPVEGALVIARKVGTATSRFPRAPRPMVAFGFRCQERPSARGTPSRGQGPGGRPDRQGAPGTTLVDLAAERPRRHGDRPRRRRQSDRWRERSSSCERQTVASLCPGSPRPASFDPHRPRWPLSLGRTRHRSVRGSRRERRYGRVQRRNVKPGASVRICSSSRVRRSVEWSMGPEFSSVAGAVLAAQRRGNWGLEPAETETTDVRVVSRSWAWSPARTCWCARTPTSPRAWSRRRLSR
jgi:hypothetical protein